MILCFQLYEVESTFHDKPIEKYMDKKNMNKLSVNVRNVAVWLKQLLGEILLLFQKTIKYYAVWMCRNYKCFWNINWYRWNIWCLEWIWRWNSPPLPHQNEVKISAVCLIRIIEVWVSQGFFLNKFNRIFWTTNVNITGVSNRGIK